MRRLSMLIAVLATMFGAPLSAQDTSLAAGVRVTQIVTDPAEVVMEAGSTIPLSIRALDAAGNVVNASLRVRGRGLDYSDGNLTAAEGGDYVLVASVVLPGEATAAPASATIAVHVNWPAIARISVETANDHRLYAGTEVRYGAQAFFANGISRKGVSFSWSTSDADVATVDAWGSVTAHSPGSVSITASYEGVEGAVRLAVPALDATALELRGGIDQVRQGDVVTFQAVATGGAAPVTDVPVMWSVFFEPDDTINAPGAAGIVNEGKFVGEVPGQYTVLATAGDLVARRKVDVRARGAVQDVELNGRGGVSDQRSSDLWMFEGVDGRDYGLTGTWGAEGWAFFWDVTNPTAIAKIDSIQVDARTVNDVKVAPNGRYAALSREGASTRKDGPVLVDLSDPMHPVIASYIEDSHITGGVHNMFAMDNYLFALSNGDKYVIFDVTDLKNPKFVSEYNHPNSRVHDVWVHDGVAYSSEWGTGVVVVDVGNGKWGGSIENPVFVTAVPYPVGQTHAAFPYYSESADKFYLFLGDEIMGRGDQAWRGTGLNTVPAGRDGTPVAFSGYVHIIDFTDPEHPLDIARYEVPEFGTHNMWVEDDVLYQAYYDGGVRMVDVSGELMGNLATQGREIAVFKPFTSDGFTPNVSMVWGAQPYKGNIFFSDLTSGLWSVKLKPTQRPIS
ncbi:MAG: Ig-like domain-containing protein [Gemmatimonadetes bacterium]|nr:Ig-like domain-containing protein [Gemmatimonadota bacterium]